jgi:hypothetical protein
MTTIPLHAHIIHVPADSTTIQGGINGAVDGDTVMVAPGTYFEHDIDFLDKAITVTGTDPEDVVTVARTIVDGDSLGSVFLLQSGEDSSSILTGLTITNGFASNGGGIFCGSSPTIAKNIITGNSTSGSWTEGWGAGIYCGTYSFAKILSNLIVENDASWCGGGIYCQTSSYALIDNNVISGNSARSGGGLYIRHASPNVTNNLISKNTVTSNGAGMLLTHDSSIIRGNLIVENAITYYGTGGAIYSTGSSTRIENNVIAGNSGNNGLGLFLSPSLTISNTIFWDNEGPEIYARYYGGGLDCHVTISYSDLQGGIESVVMNDCDLDWGEGMIDANPMFLMTENEDYRLLWRSPCIDTGHPDSLDGDGTRRDIGAFYFDQNEQITLYMTPDTTWVERGSQLGITYTVINRWEQEESFSIETEVILPNGISRGPFEPIQFSLPGETMEQFYRLHDIPDTAPLGSYEYWLRSLFPINTVPGEDHFTFQMTN